MFIKDFIFSIFEPYAGLLQKCETWCGLERWDEVRVLARVQLVHGQLEEYVGSAVRSAGDRAAGAQSIDLIETQMLTRYIAFTPTRGRCFPPHLGHLVIPSRKQRSRVLSQIIVIFSNRAVVLSWPAPTQKWMEIILTPYQPPTTYVCIVYLS